MPDGSSLMTTRDEGRKQKMKVWRWTNACIAVALLTLPMYVLAGEPAKGVQQLEPVVVTATKYATPIQDVAASMTVVTAEELKEQNLPNNDVADALRAVPGVTLRRAYSPFPAYLNIRGATDAGTVVLVNGVPTEWEITQAIPFDNIERVEVLRGPGSALYGANAVGGVVNIITKEGGKGFESSIGGGYGTFNTRRGTLTSRGGFERFHYSFAGYTEKSDGTNIVRNNVNPGVHMIDDCPYDKSAASITTGYDLPNKGKLSFLYNFFHDKYTRGRPNVGGDWDRHFTTLSYDQPLSDRLAFKGYVGYRYDDLLHLYDKGGTNYALNQKRDTDYSEIPFELQLTATLGWGNTVTGGFFANHQKTDYDYKNALGAELGTVRYSIRTLAGYLQDVWKPVENLAITGGLRFDQWKNYDNAFYNYTDKHPGNRTDENWSPKIGAKYTFADSTALWANYAVGFVPLTPEQLYDDRTSGGNPRVPNPDLKPEKTQSWELGVERWFGGVVGAKAAGFYSYTEDKIISWFNSTNVWMNKNIGRTKSYGVELDLTYQPTPNWILSANYTWNPVKIDKNSADPSLEGNDLPFSPRHKINVGVTYTRPANFTVSAFLRYLSDQQSTDSNVRCTSSGEEQFMRASYVVDVKATKHFQINQGYLRGIDLSVSVDNVFNEKYRTFYIYEDPGTVFLTELKLFF